MATLNIADPTGQTAIEGQSAEDKFKLIAKKKFPAASFNPASDIQDRIEHWDFAIDGKKYEVKGMKRLNRRDVGGGLAERQDQWITIELRAGSLSGKSYPGWVYGKADYLAFEQADGTFLVVPRQAVANFVDSEKIDKTHYVARSEEAKYRVYTRTNPDGSPKNDLVTQIQKSDLLAMPHEIWSERDQPAAAPIKFKTMVVRGGTGPGGKQLFKTQVTVTQGNKVLANAVIDGKLNDEQAKEYYKTNPAAFGNVNIPGFREWVIIYEEFYARTL
jgi:hypothetical protein